jgi:hypothetical protein
MLNKTAARWPPFAVLQAIYGKVFEIIVVVTFL